MAALPGCTITDTYAVLSPSGAMAGHGGRITARASVTPLFVQQSGGTWIEHANTVVGVTEAAGSWTLVLPSQPNCDPPSVTWTITLPDGTAWAGAITAAMVTASQSAPLTLHVLKATYGWTATPVALTTPLLGVAGGIATLDSNSHVLQQAVRDSTEAQTNDTLGSASTITNNLNRLRYQLGQLAGGAWTAAVQMLPLQQKAAPSGVPSLDANSHVLQQPVYDATEAATNDTLGASSTVTNNLNRLRYQLGQLGLGTWNALAAAIPLSQKGAASGVCDLDSAVHVPLSRLSGVTGSQLSSSAALAAGQIASVNPSALTGSGTVPVAGLPAATRSSAGTVRQSWVDVKDYGATGDGVTDDSAAIQAAIAAGVAAGGAQVQAGAGTYLAHGLQVPASIQVVGHGRGRTILRYNGAGDGVILNVGASGVLLDGLSFDGSSPAGGKPNFLVVTGAVDDVTVRNCDFKNYIGIGFYAVLNPGNGVHRRIRVLDSTFGPPDTSVASPEGTRLGVQIGSSDLAHYNLPGGTAYDRCLVSRCHFTGNPTEPDLCTLTTSVTAGATVTSLSTSATSAFIFSGMIIRVDVGGTVETYTTSAQVSAGATSIPVQSQTAAATHPVGSRVRYQYDSRGDMDGVYFQGCTNSRIEGCSQIYGNDIGFDLEYCQGCVIEGCSAEANVNAGIGFFQQATSCQIIGCTTRNNNLNGMWVGRGCSASLVCGGISFNDGRGYVVNDNNAVSIGGCIGNQLLGCQYTAAPASARQNPGGAAIVRGQDTLVQGCLFPDALTVDTIAVGTTVSGCHFPPGGSVNIIGAQTWLRANTFRGSAAHVVALYAQATDAYVTHNVFHNCGPAVFEPTGASTNSPVIAYNIYSGSTSAPPSDLQAGTNAVVWHNYTAGVPQETSKGFNSAITSVSATYQATVFDRLILVNATTAPVVITLPRAFTLGLDHVLSIKKTDGSANAVTLATLGGDTVDTAVTLSAASPKVTLLCDGAGAGHFYVLA